MNTTTSTADVIAAHRLWAAQKLQNQQSDRAAIAAHHQWANIQRAMAAAEEERLRRLSTRSTLTLRLAAQMERVHDEVIALASMKPTPRPATITNPHAAALSNHAALVDHKAQVMEELERSAHRRESRAAVAQEQHERITMMKMDTVLEKLVRTVNGTRVLLQANIEQVRRVNDPAPPVRDTAFLDAFNATLEVIPRSADAASARYVTGVEQAQRIQRATARTVFTEMERKANRRTAATAMAEEQAQRVTAAQMQPVLEQLTRAHNRLVATFLCDQERVRRCQERKFFRPATLPPALAAEITRAVTVRQVIVQMEEERAHRVQKDLGRQVFSLLVRVVAQRGAWAAVGEEQARRVYHTYYAHQVVPTLNRRGHVVAVVAAAEAEREERMAHDRAAWAPGPKKNPTKGERFAVLLSEIRRHGAQAIAKQLMRAESERRVRVAYFKNRVLPELVDRETRRTITAAVKFEQSQIVIREYVVQQVHAEYFRALQQAFATSMAESERTRRLSHAPPTPPLQLCAVQEALIRTHNAKEVASLMETERAQRMCVDKYQPVLEDIVRVHARRQVKAAAALEQGRRVTASLMQAVTSELHRMKNSAEANYAMDNEQLRRISEPTYRAAKPLPKPPHFRAFGAPGSQLVESSH